MRVLRMLGASAAVFSLAATLAPASAAPATGEPITIGAILSMTGPYAPLGEPERNALQIAEKDINASGGVGGRPIRIQIVDDEGKADTASQLATQFVGQKVAAIIGGTLTPTSQAISRVTSQAKVLQIFMTPTQQIWNTPQGVVHTVFEVTPRNELETRALTDFAKKQWNTKKIAILADDQQYGQTGTRLESEEAKTQGLDVVDTESFAPSATDVTPQLVKMKATNPDTVFLWTASPVAGIAVNQMKQQNLNYHVIGSTGIVSDNFLRITGKNSDGVYADMDLDVTHPNTVQRKFLTLYRNAYKTRANNFASFAWDAAHVAALALTATKGNTDGDALANALESMKPYQGTTGRIAFTKTDHNGLSASDIRICFAKGGVWFTSGK